MKIAIDGRSLENKITGVGRYLGNLLRYWQKYSTVNFIIYFKDRIPELSVLDSKNFKTKLVKPSINSNALWQHWTLSRALKEDYPDVFFSPSYILPFNYNGKSVVTIHDISYEAHPEWFPASERLFLRYASKKSAMKAKHIFTVSEFSGLEIMKYYKISPDKISVIYIGPDEYFKKITRSTSIKDISLFKEKYGLRSDFIIFNGSMFSRRRPKEFLEAFHRLKTETRLPLQLVVVGEDMTYPKQHIDKYIAEINSALKEEAVIHMNFMPEEDLLVAYNMALFDVYISDYEGFGLPPLESLACGTPSIVSNTEVSREIMGDNAFFVKNNGDIEEIKKAMVQMANNEEERNKIVRSYEDRILRFSFENCAKETLKKLIEIANV